MFIVKTFYTKNPDAKWFTVPDGTDASLLKILNSHPSILKNKTRKIGKDKKVNIRFFASQDSYNKFMDDLSKDPIYQEKLSYQDKNGISAVVKKFIQVE